MGRNTSKCKQMSFSRETIESKYELGDYDIRLESVHNSII